MIQVSLQNRRILTLVFPGLLPGKTVQGNDWHAATFEEIIAYLSNKKLVTLTIADFVKLANGSVQVEIPGGLP
jgi:hypothetical protein